ncbi:actin-binding ADF family protein [Aspergillus puulaauensis]|uniref:Cofilin n=1 Tax=Aspergillus puulaauensis TaxID=1220207 RepID=A0A7R8ANZ6_9EURO|nr:uncharacterized protein APUU_50148S [Aspergillus puulaauensis]BCS25437.1 hypothetical protein APUU_50148S [Aspergillus puulaauensis]
MSLLSGVEISNDCLTAYKNLVFTRGAAKPTFIIYRISDDEQSIIVEDTSTEKDYEVFLQKLTSAVDAEGKHAPRYAVYDVEYDLEEGRRAATVFITWMPDSTSTRTRMLYASTTEQLRRALNVRVSIHADDPHDIEWKAIMSHMLGRRI